MVLHLSSSLPYSHTASTWASLGWEEHFLTLLFWFFSFPFLAQLNLIDCEWQSATREAAGAQKD